MLTPNHNPFLHLVVQQHTETSLFLQDFSKVIGKYADASISMSFANPCSDEDPLIEAFMLSYGYTKDTASMDPIWIQHDTGTFNLPTNRCS